MKKQLHTGSKNLGVERSTLGVERSDSQRVPVLDEQTDLEATCAILGIELEDLLAELNFRQRQKQAKMRREMVLAARVGGQRRILRDRGDGGGEVTMQVHKTSYHYWGQRLGYECWDDPQFVREYLRDNPEARVRSTSNRTVLTVNGRRSPARPASRPRITGRGRWAA